VLGPPPALEHAGLEIPLHGSANPRAVSQRIVEGWIGYQARASAGTFRGVAKVRDPQRAPTCLEVRAGSSSIDRASTGRAGRVLSRVGLQMLHGEATFTCITFAASARRASYLTKAFTRDLSKRRAPLRARSPNLGQRPTYGSSVKAQLIPLDQIRERGGRFPQKVAGGSEHALAGFRGR
jgi:hypothetical protein